MFVVSTIFPITLFSYRVPVLLVLPVPSLKSVKWISTNTFVKYLSLLKNLYKTF